ncbi:MAG: hypothetical protein JXR48_07010 [Candidatus Delongbacteria bacterium]|nr:hypothetical protein [Candidatus Delongbacteria bacterium]
MNIKLIYIYLMLFLSFNAFSQVINERIIKLSGNYFYGESQGKNDSILKQVATLNLISNIAHEYKYVDKGDILAKNIEYLIVEGEYYCKVICYVEKNEVVDTVSNPTKKKMVVNQIKIETKQDLDSKDKIKVVEPINAPQNLRADSVIQLNSIISEIVKLKNSDSLFVFLTSQKNLGNIAYNTDKKVFQNYEHQCYILIFCEGKLSGLLAPGLEKRYDYLNKEYIYQSNINNSNKIQLWLQIIQ